MIDWKRFVLAGKAYITINNNKGEHFTFKVVRPDESYRKLDAYFISVLSGSNNLRDYSYLGMLDARTGEIRPTKGSKVSSEAKSWKVAAWMVRKVFDGTPFPEGYNLNHEGRCCCCGKLLTTLESVSSGFGSTCRAKMGL